LDLPHDGACSPFTVAVVEPPAHLLTVKVIAKETAAPIAASLTSTPLPARDESRYGPGKLGSFGTAPSLLHAELGWIDRHHAALANAVTRYSDPLSRRVMLVHNSETS